MTPTPDQNTALVNFKNALKLAHKNLSLVRSKGIPDQIAEDLIKHTYEELKAQLEKFKTRWWNEQETIGS